MFVRLLIGIPSFNEFWHYQFAISIANLLKQCDSQKFALATKGQYVALQVSRGSILPVVRQSLADYAIENEFTHLLTIDNDQTFPCDLAHRLMAANRQVIACNIPTKMVPSTTNTRLNDGTPGGEVVYTDSDSIGCRQVWRAGTGIMMVKTEVFKKIKYPYYNMHWGGEEKGWVGEDWGFCERLEEAGIPIHIHQSTSAQIGHVGSIEYTHDVVGKVVKGYANAAE